MTEIQAIKILEEEKSWESDNRKIDAFTMAISALEKQIPKKVVIKSWSPAICPTCGEELSESMGDGYYKHWMHLQRCPNPDCSQRLDWDL